MTKPKIKYANSKGVFIAYQVFGQGPHDVIIVPGFVSNLEIVWEEPGMVRFLERLASFSRVIMFDKRGTGLSDRGMAPTLEERMDDVLAVMEAERWKQAVLFGVSEGGPMSVLFAATYPERTSALILYGSWAKGARTEDYPWMLSEEQYERWIASVPNTWGEPEMLQYWAPSAANDEYLSEWWGRFMKGGASPGAAINLIKLYAAIDVRPILGSVQVPTLVIHRQGDKTVRVGNGRYLAEHIPEAKYVELPGVDHLWWIKEEGKITAAIEEFLLGDRPALSLERTLATVLFTDIVDSTTQALQAGDEQWLQLMEQHDHIVRQEISNFQGREIRSTGDGFLIIFDGPSRAVFFAEKVREVMKKLGLEIRAGIHTGEIEIKGQEIGGIGVHIASRVMGAAEGPAIMVSSTVKDLIVGAGVEFEDKGKHALKGIEGEWRLFEVVD